MTVPACPICSQGFIIKPKLEIQITVRKKRENTEDYQATGIKAKTKSNYLRQYYRLERHRVYRAEYARKARAEQRLKFGKALW